MADFDEFKSPTKAPPADKDVLRSSFPACAAIIDDFKQVFGDVVVMRVVEGGQEIKTKNYERWNVGIELSVDTHIRLGELAKLMTEFMKAKEAANARRK